MRLNKIKQDYGHGSEFMYAAYINNVAGNKIEALASKTDQLNMLAHSSELILKLSTGATLEPTEEAEKESMIQTWSLIKQIREHAGYLKSECDKGNSPEMDQGWPV